MKKLAVYLCLGLLIADFAKTAAGQSSLSILPSTLPAGTAGTPYSEQLTPSGGSGAGYQFSIVAGASNLTNLGLSLSDSGLISGTTIAGTAAFTVQLTDSLSDTITQAYTLAVNQTKVLHSFPGVTEGDSSSPDGIQPNSLIQAQDGNFYGTTAHGGNAGSGTVFRLNADGSDTIIYSFSGGADGGSPTGLLQGPNGNLYGTTSFGGASITANSACTNNDFNDPKNGDSAPCCVDGTGTNNIGCGTLFTISPAQPPLPGKIQTLVNFDGSTMGAFPNPLTIGLATDGVTPVFYGSSQPCSYCVTNGSLFSFNPASSSFEALSFGASGLAYPNALLQGECTNGKNCDYNLYGTTQLGGGTCPSNEFNDNDLGCGGVFKYNTQTQTDTLLCELGSDNSNNQDAGFAINSSTRTADPAIISDSSVIRQSGVRFPSGLEWSFSSVTLSLTESSDGSIIGTTPWACFPGPGGNSVGPDCGMDTNDAATVFQCQPPFTGTNSGAANTIYQFTGDSVQDGNVSGATDGGGSLAGVMLASDGNFYSSSGSGIFDITGPEMANFLTSAPSTPPAQLANLNAIALLESTASPNWMIQGSDGNFYGTSSTGGANGAGAVFEVSPANPLPSPVQLSFPNSQITLGSSATLTWSVPNAYSLTSQQCYPFVPNSQSGAGIWSGAGQGSVSSGVFSNSASITPTEPGTYEYAVTCGGTISGFTTLQVDLPAPVATLSATSLTFGGQMIGTSSASQSVTLTNTGSATLHISSVSVTGANASSFVFVSGCGASLAAGANCSIHGHFTPTASGALTAAVTIIDNASGSPQSISLSGTGESQASLSSTSLSFGNQKVGTTSASQSVTLTNIGATPLLITSIAVTGTDASSFVFATSCGSSLAAAANCTIHGHFTPTTSGALTAAVTITDNASGSPQSISLSGTGESQASLSSASLSFGNQKVGTTSASQSVTLTNIGATPLTITSIAVTGTNASSFVFATSCGSSLAAAANCSIHGHFTPTTSGALTAAVTITDNASGSPQLITLSGTGESQASLSSTSLSYGNQAVGTTSASQSVTLTNIGATPLTITSIAVTGTDASSFGFAYSCGSSLAAGASCLIHGHFAPTTTGLKSAAVTITDNASGSPQSITLSGTGTTPPAVSLTSTSLSFSGQTVGTTSASQSVTMTNTGGSPLSITSIAVTGANASSFVFANSCGTSLAIGANCTIHGHFTPTTTGALSAAVTITDNASASPQSITLSGTGQ